MDDLIMVQKAICDKYGAPFSSAPSDLKVGIALNTLNGNDRINGLRHPIEGETSGWYIWGGETLSSNPDFFVPLHIEHLIDEYPRIAKYLGLAPGWRFLIAENYEDVWEDQSLLDI